MLRSRLFSFCCWSATILLLPAVLWLLLQHYVHYRLQQELNHFNQQYQLQAVQHAWPVLQLQLGSSRFVPWLDLLEVYQLELALPNGAALLQLPKLELRGILQGGQQFEFTAADTLSSAMQISAGSILSYQLSWQQLSLNPALQLLMPAELSGVLQPVAGVVHWQQFKGQFWSQIQLQMADKLLLHGKLQLKTQPAAADEGLAQLHFQQIQLQLQQKLLPALMPWLASQGFSSESSLFLYWQQQLARCQQLPKPLWQAFFAWQQQPEHLVVKWQAESALPLSQWQQLWHCSTI